MADTDQLLEKIGTLIDQKLEPLQKQFSEQGANIVRLVQGQKRLETEQEEQGKDIKTLKVDVSTLKADVKTVDQKIETVDLKVEAVHEFNKKAHEETMETLLDTGEINYQELKKELAALKKRIEQLEEDRYSQSS